MKKGFVCMILCAVAIGLLSGCGGRFAEKMTAGKDGAKAATGTAVSGQAVCDQAVSDQAAQTDDEGRKSRRDRNGRCFSGNCYYTRWLKDSIVQTSLKTGEEEKIIQIGEIEEVIYVEKDVLYYTKGEDEDGECYSLWRLPIECHEDGTEELKADQAEQLKGLDDICFETDYIYIDDDYIVYSRGKDEPPNLDVTRYDRKSGEKPVCLYRKSFGNI